MKDAGMSTQMVVHLEIAPFTEQVEIDLAQCGGETVGIFEFDHACRRLASQPIAEWLIAPCRADENAFGMDARDFGYCLTCSSLDHPKAGGTRLKAADLESSAGFVPMQPQEAEGVAMVGAQQRLDMPAIAELALRWFAGPAGTTMSGRFGFRRAQGSSLLPSSRCRGSRPAPTEECAAKPAGSPLRSEFRRGLCRGGTERAVDQPRQGPPDRKRSRRSPLCSFRGM